MDIGRTRAQANATITEDKKIKKLKEGKCFHCDQKGHISCYCPQRSNQIAEASTSTSSNATIAMATITSNKALSADQKVDIYLTQLYNESDKVCTQFANIMFNKKEDFPHA